MAGCGGGILGGLGFLGTGMLVVCKMLSSAFVAILLTLGVVAPWERKVW